MPQSQRHVGTKSDTMLFRHKKSVQVIKSDIGARSINRLKKNVDAKET